jgi:hypothetical protein
MIEWWAWVDLNHRPRPYQSSVVRFYNNLQDRGDCQTTRKSHKTSHFVGWAVGWKKPTNSETTPHSFHRTSFWIVSELPIIRELLHLMDTRALSVPTPVDLPTTGLGSSDDLIVHIDAARTEKPTMRVRSIE